MYQQVIVTGIPQSTPSLVVVHTHPLWGHCGSNDGPFDVHDYSVHLQPVMTQEEFESAVDDVNAAARTIMTGGCSGPQTPKVLFGFLIFLGLLIGGIVSEVSENTFHFPILVIIAMVYLFIYCVVLGIWYRRLTAQMIAKVNTVLEEINAHYASRNMRFSLRQYQDPHHHHHHHHHGNNTNNLKHMYLEIEIGQQQQQPGFYPPPPVQQVPYPYPPQGSVVVQQYPQQPQYAQAPPSQTYIPQQPYPASQTPQPQYVQTYDPNQQPTQYIPQQQPQYVQTYDPNQQPTQYIPQQQQQQPYDLNQQYLPQQELQQQQSQFVPQLPPPPQHHSTPTPHPDQPVLITSPPDKNNNNNNNGQPPSDNNGSLL